MPKMDLDALNRQHWITEGRKMVDIVNFINRMSDIIWSWSPFKQSVPSAYSGLTPRHIILRAIRASTITTACVVTLISIFDRVPSTTAMIECLIAYFLGYCMFFGMTVAYSWNRRAMHLHNSIISLNTKSFKNWKYPYLGICGLICFIFISEIILIHDKKNHQIEDGYRKNLSALADMSRKECPRMVNQFYRLNNFTSGPGTKFTTSWTILNASSRSINNMTPAERTNLNNFLNESIRKYLQNTDLNVFRTNKAELVWVYYTPDNKMIAKITLLPGDY